MREIKKLPPPGRRWVFESLPSTNRWALDNLARLRHGDVVWARQQTRGKGRFDRVWASPGDRNLTVSILLDERRLPPHVAATLSQLAALAVRTLLARRRIPASLKWPNDVLIRGRKIAGILAEKHSTSPLIVLGLGLNVNMTPADFRATSLPQPATSMQIQVGRPFAIPPLLTALVAALHQTLTQARNRGAGFLLDAWKRHDTLAGRCIAIDTPAGSLRGRYAGLTPEGRLHLLDSRHRSHFLSSGDVTLRKPGRPPFSPYKALG